MHTNELIGADVIRRNLSYIRERIKLACERIGRSPDTVQLLLATKTVPIETIQIALEAGERLLGENKVQEALGKQEALAAYGTEWHMIGHLQRNKIKHTLRFAQTIESVDRLSLAQQLQQRLEYEDRTLPIYIQVNTSYEPSKFGVPPEDALTLIRAVHQLDRLQIRGLMTIGVFSAEAEQVRPCFRLLRQIQQQALELALPGADFSTLSMGMSGDFETAIEEGATLVRVGTAVFGQRLYPDSYYWNET
ncbi:YggS family pyridoxal phosphate-dependent enzyme [Spirosoma flavus]